MARYMTKLWPGRSWPAGRPLAAGCHCGWASIGGHGDPCWPDRYANESRAALVANFQPQVENGQVLDQTVWNTHFEYGTDKLNGAGMDKLDQIARRRPAPGPAGVHPDGPGHRLRRGASRTTTRPSGRSWTPSGSRRVQKYLTASLTGRPATFDIQVHDPADAGHRGGGPAGGRPDPASSRVGSGAAVVGPGGRFRPPAPPAGTPRRPATAPRSGGPRM